MNESRKAKAIIADIMKAEKDFIGRCFGKDFKTGMKARNAAFGECIKKLNLFANACGWACDINSWIQKKDRAPMWVIQLHRGPLCVRACGSSLLEAANRMLDLLAITEKSALKV